ncbi:hypothetical protein BB560_000396 [Smittium megazygosporum]|uniref:B-block binding subunit of TFIIIC domain-containing protein n=1 Tax=Smittium megazygosporum TaxID=133381 RepID=A0A2T9ZKH3_9FUNG|nr:hypothetical protein BB560_000396 [Smittium megazygosporum]
MVEFVSLIISTLINKGYLFKNDDPSENTDFFQQITKPFINIDSDFNSATNIIFYNSERQKFARKKNCLQITRLPSSSDYSDERVIKSDTRDSSRSKYETQYNNLDSENLINVSKLLPSYTIKGLQVGLKFVFSLGTYGYKDIFYRQAEYFEKLWCNRKLLGNYETLCNILSPSYLGLTKYQTNNVNPSASDTCLPSQNFRKSQKYISINKGITAGELSYLVDLVVNNVAEIGHIKHTNPILLSNQTQFWKEACSSLNENTFLLLEYPKAWDSSLTDNSSVYFPFINKGLRVSSDFHRSGIDFKSLLFYVDSIVFNTGATGATILDIKMALLTRLSPPLTVPSDAEIYLAVEFLDSYNLLGVKYPGKYSQIPSLLGVSDKEDYESNRDLRNLFRGIYRVGFHDTRYVSKKYASLWSIITTNDSLSRRSSAFNFSSEKTEMDQDSIKDPSEPQYTRSGEVPSNSENLKPSNSVIINGALKEIDDSNDEQGLKEHSKNAILIPTKIWFNVNSKINYGLVKVVIESTLSLIANKPGVSEAAISRKFSQSLSNSEISEILDYLVSVGIIYKKTIKGDDSFLKTSSVQNSLLNPKIGDGIVNSLYSISSTCFSDTFNTNKSNGLQTGNTVYNIDSGLNLTASCNSLIKPGAILFSENPSCKIIPNESIVNNTISYYWVVPNYLKLVSKILPTDI